MQNRNVNNILNKQELKRQGKNNKYFKEML